MVPGPGDRVLLLLRHDDDGNPRRTAVPGSGTPEVRCWRVSDNRAALRREYRDNGVVATWHEFESGAPEMAAAAAMLWARRSASLNAGRRGTRAVVEVAVIGVPPGPG